MGGLLLSSSCHAACTAILDPLSPLLPIVHRLRQVFSATSRILTEPLYVCWAGRPAFARPYVGVHRSTSLMSSSLLLQQCPASLVRLTWIVFVMGGRWPYSWCFNGYISFLISTLTLLWGDKNILTAFGVVFHSVKAASCGYRGSPAFMPHGWPYSSLKEPPPGSNPPKRG